MFRYRSLIALILVAVTSLLVSCSSPTPTAKAPTYTTDQLTQIQQYTTRLQSSRDRMLELPPLVQQKRWTDVESLIHGPLGEIRATMLRLSRNLLPSEQKAAETAAKETFEHLIAIDEAAQAQDGIKALRNYNELLKDFDAFIEKIPS
ncbi:photosystem II protein PsbQ [Leptolyngbya ohadii]|uniref:photosystem II protein PsbQ n=1 Tax=Leptolyngbya ohadii TaxID=1962290 RepID=UPI000B59ABF1|nr:photosystem II protein PsbQ [Leptolyngbya ohadii]